jgi:hypothetical protein
MIDNFVVLRLPLSDDYVNKETPIEISLYIFEKNFKNEKNF